MKQNIGVADRMIRLIAAIILIDLAASNTFSGFGHLGIWTFALILLVTAAVGFSPAYAIFGFRTKADKKLN